MDMANFPHYFHYWGKSRRGKMTERDTVPYHLLAYHSLDVAACLSQLIAHNSFAAADIISELGLEDEEGQQLVVYSALWHDIGKFAKFFQQKVAHPNTPLVYASDSAFHHDLPHDEAGFWLWQNRLRDWWLNDPHSGLPAVMHPTTLDRDKAHRTVSFTLSCWLQPFIGHHGKPPSANQNHIFAFDEQDLAAVKAYLRDITILLQLERLPICFSDKTWREQQFKPNSWLLAAIVVLADWLGSNEIFFPYLAELMPLTEYWQLAQQRARQAIAALPQPSQVVTHSDYQALFPYLSTLTPLQQQACDLDLSMPGPHLIVLEDVTGAGKTEAALILAQRLMAKRKAQGVYFALPTMATANAIFQRLALAYRALYQVATKPSLVLAHSARLMVEEFSQSIWQADNQGQAQYGQQGSTATSDCNYWFADSRKKALLAEVGVGTLDQALMAVMPFKHQTLRLLGLKNKLLILDEVHAYDSYMLQLLQALLSFHAAQGGSVIILSATLPQQLRQDLVKAFAEGCNWPAPSLLPQAGYPWLTHLNQRCQPQVQEIALGTRAAVERTVMLHWLSSNEQALDYLATAVQQGKCVCWIRNSVEQAVNTYQQLLVRNITADENLLLFHSRFALCDRLHLEQQVLNWFGKQSTAQMRTGKILIATQVVEQSLDIDVDYMLTDLAPIDLVIQRAGRLQRHLRDRWGDIKQLLPDERPVPQLAIIAPDWQPEITLNWLDQLLPHTALIYPDLACLYRTHTLLQQRGKIQMPQDARLLIEGVYRDDCLPLPDALQQQIDKTYAQQLGQRAIARLNSLQRKIGYDRSASDNLVWENTTELSTRLGEKTLDLYLAYMTDEGLKPYAASKHFSWEQSRLRIRIGWWNQHHSQLPALSGEQLAQFRQQHHFPTAEVLLLQTAYYSAQLGLVGPQ